MKKVKQIIAAYQVRPADVIVLRKKFLGLVDHYAVFLGWEENTGNPVFAANYVKGTLIISQWELEMFLNELEPLKIERFIGNDHERMQAVKRGLSEIGKNDYNYFTNNCEHYKNFVQTGRKHSEQVEDAKKALATALVGVLFVALLDSFL